MAAMTRYMLDNARHESADRFAALSALFDSTTTRHLERCGVRRGWRCLEVGAGGGSIATWLADRVGASGAVLATDIEPRFLSALARPSMEVRRHDIGVDALPERAFDLVHARLVLMHVPDRDQALERMIGALKPGGWIVAEEFDSVSLPPAPDQCPLETRLDTQIALLKLIGSMGGSCTGRCAPMDWSMWTRKVAWSCCGTALRASPCCAPTTRSCAARWSKRVILPRIKLNRI
jgi:ubiquinone/menaquinone biosynthesis C-methylase UbiE